MKSFRKQKIKLVKDLAEGQNNLCQSLVDMAEFQDIDQLFSKKKTFFNIAKRRANYFQPHVPVSQQQINYDLTPLQKIQLYKKQKIKSKFNFQFSNEISNKMFKIRRSKIPNMLNNLNQSMKRQSQQIFQRQIKTSQQKLRFFRSQGKLKQNLKGTFDKYKTNQQESRCRFYSLKSGKPEMNQKLFPTFQQYVQGKNRAKLQQKYAFDINKLENSLTNFYTQSDQNAENDIQSGRSRIPMSLPIKRRKKFQKQVSQSPSNFNFKKENLSKTQTFSTKVDKFQNINRYSDYFIGKSEKSSKKIVKTMTNFYQTRNSKKQQYNNMVQYYDHDRPLTNSIRRSQYALSLGQKLKSLNFYRAQSQTKRVQILSHNSSTYIQLIQTLSKYHQDDIPISLQILRQLRQLMKREYIFTQNDVYKLLKSIKQKSLTYFQRMKSQNPQESQEDFMMQPMIEIINKRYNFTFNWDSL